MRFVWVISVGEDSLEQYSLTLFLLLPQGDFLNILFLNCSSCHFNSTDIVYICICIVHISIVSTLKKE